MRVNSAPFEPVANAHALTLLDCVLPVSVVATPYRAGVTVGSPALKFSHAASQLPDA